MVGCVVVVILVVVVQVGRAVVGCGVDVVGTVVVVEAQFEYSGQSQV